MSKTKEYASTFNVVCNKCGAKKKLLEDCKSCIDTKKYYPEFIKTKNSKL